MAALIGALRVSLSADTAAFQQGMKRAERQAKTSASSIQKSFGLIKAGFAGFVSGISIGLITQGIKASLDYAGSLGEIAQQLGVTTRELQTFRYAVAQNGGTVEQADQALGKFAISISKAQSGSKQAAAAFDAVGVKLSDLATKSKTEILGQIADRMKATGGASANAAAGVAIFGRGFQKIIPTLDQGSAGMNELAAAADELGIVLSDEQIQNADRTADKLDSLMTVLKARVAGEVSDNSDAILSLSSALLELASVSVTALASFANFVSYVAKNPLSHINPAAGVAGFVAEQFKGNGGAVRGLNKAGTSVTIGLPPATPKPTGSPAQFLAGGGGGRKRSARAPRDTSLRDAFQFEEEQRRLDMEILRAKQDLAHDYVERAALAVEILNKEKEDFEAELQFRIASKEITAAQAEKLRLKNAEVDQLKRDAVSADEQELRTAEANRLSEHDYELQLEKLELQADLAETAQERRAAELRILDLAHREERERLERIIRESKDWEEIEKARRELLELSERQALERQGVTQRTRGPMEDWQASLPTSAEKMQEAFERLQVQGFEGLIDAAVALTEGFDSAKDALLNTLKQFLQGLLRAQLQGMLGSILPQGGFNLGSIFGGGTGGSTSPSYFFGDGEFSFATGGFTGNVARNQLAGFVHGQEGVLNTRGLSALGVPNLNALNRGAPLSALVSNDNGARTVNQNFTVYANDADSFRRNERQIARDARRRMDLR